MSAPNREQLLRMAIQSAKQGNKEGARVMFRRVISEDPRNERAMLWLAKIADSPGERQKWLERVIQINPENTTAQQALEQMAYNRSATENRRLLNYGGTGLAAFMLITVVLMMLWAFWPLPTV